MSKRLHPTLADYLVIAVSPALIMVLIGSLIFFLLEIFYQGQYVERLHVVFALFVMAAVLIGRISIEMGSGHAMGYTALLALAVIVALQRLVEYPAGAAAYSLWVNVALVGLILWCARKLTWDCTFIDESKDQSGEGVLRTMGLDRPRRSRQDPSPADKSAERKGPPSKQAPDAGSADAASTKPRPHSGGVWVVYFSLAALPLFGLGQRFIPAEAQDRRRYAFLLFCAYLASALGLLLTTSFLGLRRYLRGRRLQMPAAMAGVWITIGCLLIGAILAFALLLPRPGAEYAISEVPWHTTSPRRDASRWAVGKEGTDDSRKDAPGGEDHRPADAKKQSGDAADGKAGQGQEGSQGRHGSQAERSAGEGAGQKTSDAKAPKGSGGQGESDGRETSQSGPAGEGKSAESKGAAGDSKGGSQQQGKDGSSAGQQRGSPGKAKGESPSDRKTSQDQRADARRDARSQSGSTGGRSQPESPPPAPRPPSPMPSWNFPLAWILKWLFYLAMIVAVAYGVWKSRSALAEALRDLLESLRALWASLFGGKRREKAGPAEAAAETKVAPRPFADFADPFAAGWAERWSPDELVRYSFAALEAWAREHGCPRGLEQTPHEFAQNVADRSKSLGGHCRKMAELYSRAAYAPGTLPPTSLAPLRDFWQQLTAA